MSTRCLIGLAYGKKVYFSYCNCDGYPEHMVPILRAIYDEDFLFKRIISKGEFRFLDKKCIIEEPYENALEHECSLEDFINDKTEFYSDYRYLYCDGTWKCYGVGPEGYDQKDWEEIKNSYSNLFDMENRNIDGSYNFYYAPETEERQFLVQRIYTQDVGIRENTIMNSNELINYIDTQDYYREQYKIFEITEFGVFSELFYRGWQPGCRIEFTDKNGQIVLSGYGTDH